MCTCGGKRNRLGSNFGGAIDLDVLYTGCLTACNGDVIPKDSSIRDVLEMLLKNCGTGGGDGGSKWYSGQGVPTFPANDGDYYLQANGAIWEYDTELGWVDTGINLGGITVVNWGSIEGDIEDQQDLIDLINSISVDLTQSAGVGLYYNSTTSKIDLGANKIIPTYRVVELKQDDDAFIIAWPEEGSLFDYTKARFQIQPTGAAFFIGNGASYSFNETNLSIQIPNTFSLTADGTATALNAYADGGVLDINANDIENFNAREINIKGSFAIGGAVNISGNIIEIGKGSNTTSILVKNSGVNVDMNAVFEFTRFDGVILTSPSGNRFSLRVSDTGVLSTTPVV